MSVTISDEMVEKALDAFRRSIWDNEGTKPRAVHMRAALTATLESVPLPVGRGEDGHHGLDNERQVLFYEQDFYVLSNFSSFRIELWDRDFDTSEAAYHWMKFWFRDDNLANRRVAWIRDRIQKARSAHEAFKLAEEHKHLRRGDWDEVKCTVMRDILRAKAAQHEYVSRKLLATGDRELIENSWRDNYWGWGPNRDGKNMLGKLWMEVRAELRAKQPLPSPPTPEGTK